MRKRPVKVGILVAVLGSVPCAMGQDFDLRSERGQGDKAGSIRVTLSQRTGEVTGLADEKGLRFLSGNEDRYDLDGKLSTAADDVVTSVKVDGKRVRFECANWKLGLKLTKEYRLSGSVVEKQVTYARECADKLLLRVSSATTVESAVFREGYYYVATDDGYKVATVPFLPGVSVKEPIPWTVSTGNFVYYFPRHDQTLAHHRYRVNGRFFYGEADRNIESKFVPGGAITAIGEGFIGAGDRLALESRIVLIAGDAKDYHKHVLNEPPYADYRNRRVPSWFPKATMFLSDSGTAGTALIRDRETVAQDIFSFLKLLKEDEYLMVFFNHWTVQGDLPYRGTFRCFNDAENAYSPPVPIEKLKENIRWLKSLSPRIKVGGYATFTPTAGTPPYDDHKDWMIYNRDGGIEFYGDGTGLGGMPDFSSGYREYLLDQLKHYLTDLAFDWIHIDSATFEAVNWRTKQVVQSCEVAQFYDALGKLFEAQDAAVVQNVSWTASLWAHGSYMECQQPDRWEKKDWRILAVPGSLAALYRSYRPGVWSNLCYGTRGIYGIRNAQTGMKGWNRNALTWWPHVAYSLAQGKVVDELLQTKASEVRILPCWWKLQTEKLEAEALERGGSLIIPLLLHGDSADVHEISFKTSGSPLAPGSVLFAFDFRLARPEPLDPFKSVPWKSDTMELTDFQAEKKLGDTYRYRINLEPLCNTYHVLTQAPAWVYTANRERTVFLLPETQGVKIHGLLPLGATRYKLDVENDNHTAEILAYLPQEWAGAAISVNGTPVTPNLVKVLNGRCALIAVAKGRSAIEVSQSSNADIAGQPHVDYVNPREDVWREASERLFYHNLEHRAYEENGMSCLALGEVRPGGGSADFPVSAKSGGFSIKVKGQQSGGTIQIGLVAGEVWTYDVKDDFQGWRQFTVRKDQMRPGSTRRRFETTSSLSLRVNPAGGKGMHVADIHLTPAQPGDLPEPGVVPSRRLAVFKTKTPPMIDGIGRDACWKSCEVAADFYKYSTEKPAESKTMVKVCYDDDNLYILFDNLEPIVSLAASRVPESQVFVSDHAHLFIDPFKDSVRYYEIAVDTAGTIADIKNGPSGADMQWNGAYEVKTALNYNVGWTAEMRIPFKTLGKSPKAGDVWRITFARVDNSKEFSVWTAGEWNDPAGFGDLLFSGEPK
jgi:hypothetical protein